MTLYSVLGMGLLFVGGVLMVNGLWLHGHGADRDVAVFNLLVGVITFLIVLWWGFGGAASEGTPFNAAGTMLFSFTYLWLGVNAHRGIEDQRSFGWYCAFVAVVALPTGYLVLQTGDLGLSLLWWIWAVLWAAFFVLLALNRDEYTAPIASFTGIVGAITAIAGYLMAAGFWPWA
ncbi:AmiS/UreI family transporter [Halogranum amylolyticum]|uniref:AmiS/UreI family transporter n=1 Tax=Halogranum amylolyticum TaxID=660520 RepID=A0A1H8UYK2_9EURY|nr:AmiS/UreI family transporter [Halogranum amylolyticum]SEP08053.1 AmiS/UreI family transporter [Halogranum amylolyticum]